MFDGWTWLYSTDHAFCWIQRQEMRWKEAWRQSNRLFLAATTWMPNPPCSICLLIQHAIPGIPFSVHIHQTVVTHQSTRTSIHQSSLSPRLHVSQTVLTILYSDSSPTITWPPLSSLFTSASLTRLWSLPWQWERQENRVLSVLMYVAQMVSQNWRRETTKTIRYSIHISLNPSINSCINSSIHAPIISLVCSFVLPPMYTSSLFLPSTPPIHLSF